MRDIQGEELGVELAKMLGISVSGLTSFDIHFGSREDVKIKAIYEVMNVKEKKFEEVKKKFKVNVKEIT